MDGRTPNQVVAERLIAKPELTNPAPQGRSGPCDATKARLIANAAKEISQPDNTPGATHEMSYGRNWVMADTKSLNK